MKEKILVTGGAGFIGSHLIESLLTDGFDVVCIDSMNEYYDVTLKKARLARFLDRVTFYEKDIADKVAMQEIFAQEKPNAVAHLAAQAGVRYSLENPAAYGESNVVGTINILEAARLNNVSRVVMASSSSVYGANTKIPFAETDEVNTPVSIYAATKRATELLAQTYTHLYGLPTTCLRFFTVYGPFSRPDMAPLKFTDAIVHGKPIDVYNNGDMKRDFTYVGDIVHGFRLALEKPNGFQVYNLGNGSPVGLMDFISVLERELGMTATKHMMPMQAGDVPVTFADTSKAKKELGFESKVSIEEGVKKFVEWYRSYYH
jgi:UDP-glucuronate 4-epimerase